MFHLQQKYKRTFHKMQTRKQVHWRQHCSTEGGASGKRKDRKVTRAGPWGGVSGLHSSASLACVSPTAGSVVQADGSLLLPADSKKFCVLKAWKQALLLFYFFKSYNVSISTNSKHFGPIQL